MEILLTVLYTLVVIVALLLGMLILIQPSKSGGYGSVFGGVGESVFGARAGSHLTKATVVLTVIFFVLALLLASLVAHNRSRSGVRDAILAGAMEQPAAAQPVEAGKGAEAVKTAPAAQKSAEAVKTVSAAAQKSADGAKAAVPAAPKPNK